MIKLKPMPEEGLTLENSNEIIHDWLGFCHDNDLANPEFLLPILERKIELSEFSFLSRDRTMSAETTKAQLDQLEPWEYTLNLSGVETRPIDEVTHVEWQFHRFRVDLICKTLFRIFEDRMPGFEILDMACHCGVFSLDLAARGAGQVHGIDIREINISQAQFLKQLYDVENCEFEVGDAEHLPDRDYDIILNLGLLYHVTFPIELLQRCYDHCRVACVVDTNVYNSPFAGFYLATNKDTNLSIEGKSHAELLPTYRGLVLAMKSVGFEHIYELRGSNQVDDEIGSFCTFNRRVLIAFKNEPGDTDGLIRVTTDGTSYQPGTE